MKISWLNEVTKDMKEDNEVICFLFTKEEAEELIVNNLMQNAPEDYELTTEAWEAVVEKMGRDDGLWQSLYEAWEYYLQQAIKKGKDNHDNSK